MHRWGRVFMGNIILWAIIVLAVLIIIYRIIRLVTGKSDPCSGCSYKSDCKKNSDKKKH